MTCREFKHYAASLSLPRLAKGEDPQLTGHTEACAGCAAWLQKQRSLNAQLHALRAQTAGREAGPSVERELLRVFRQGTVAGTTSTSSARETAAGVRGALETLHPHYKAVPRSTPFAVRLSHVFELGAYAAVAAALAIAMFLGVHLLRHNGDSQPTQSKAVPADAVPAVTQPAAETHEEAAAHNEESAAPRHREVRSAHVAAASLKASKGNEADSGDAATADESQYADAGYTALMLCDPLSCASETQVVRMELPSAAEQGSQPRMADVVVGYDGVVRAVRFVN
jgi:hypothetical protein